ncbi:MAG: glycosyltransferase family 4 protein [Thermotogota bacterium]|nr:glycosyltransferase family 4 protein [Thermotogota bacterium]
MNIGIFTDTYIPQVNGVVTVVRNLKENLSYMGNNVYVFTVNHPDAEPLENVVRVPSIKFIKEPQHRIGTPFSAKINKVVKSKRLDIIHTHTEFSMWFQAMMVSRKFSLPMVHTMHTMYEEYIHYIPFLEYFASKTIKNWIKLICKNCEILVAPSQKMKNFLLNYNAYKPIKIIPNGIDLSKFYRIENRNNKDIEKFRSRFNLNQNDKVLIFVGRLGKEKGIDILLYILKKLVKSNPKIKLLLVGDGPEKRNLKILSEELNITDNTIFTGYLNWPDEIRLAYNSSDAAIVASHTESFGLVVLEALACGLPVVALEDSSFHNLIIDGESGFLCKNREEMVEKTKDLISKPEKYKEMKQKARKTAEKFSVQQNAIRTFNLYKEIVNLNTSFGFNRS